MTAEDGNSPLERSDHSVFQKTITRRDLLIGAAGAYAALSLGPLLAACGSGSSAGTTASSPASGTPTKGGYLRVGMIDFSSNTVLDPQLWGLNENDIALCHNVFEGLLAYDPKQKIIPGLAEEVTPNADATEYTARLRPDVTFQNGKAVTADDVIASYNRIKNPKDPKTDAEMLKNLKRMQKMDDRTVRFFLGTPDAVFPEVLAHYLAIILPADFEVPKKGEELVGTGPFKISRWVSGRQYDFLPFADYWGQVPYVDKMTWYRAADTTAQVNGLLGGTYDWVTQLAPTQGKLVETSAGLSLVRSPSGMYVPFAMRIDVKPFDDVRVRQAFRLVADRQQIVDSTMSGYGSLGNDMNAHFDPGYPSDLPQREQDLEQAKSLLKQAGYDNDLTVQCDVTVGNSQVAVDSAVVFAEQAKAAGVTVKVNKIDVNQFFGDNWLTYPFSTDSWATRNYIQQTRLQLQPDAPWNETHWPPSNDDGWLKLVREAERTVDDTKRNELVSEAMTIDNEQGGYITWSFSDLLDAHSSKVAGAVPDVYYISAIRWRFNQLYFA